MDITISSVNFSFYLNSCCEKCLAYGPGQLRENAVNIPTLLIIQAKNQNGQNRDSGKDVFNIRLLRSEVVIDPTPIEAGSDEDLSSRSTEMKSIDISVPFDLIDNDKGTYAIVFTGHQPGSISIFIECKDKDGSFKPIRGSPYCCEFVESAPRSNNTLNGAMVCGYITSTLKDLAEFIQKAMGTIDIRANNNIEGNVRELLLVLQKLNEIQSTNESTILTLDIISETLAAAGWSGANKEQELAETRRLR